MKIDVLYIKIFSISFNFSDRLEFCTSFLTGKNPVKCREALPLDGKMKRFSGQNQQYPDPSQPPDQGQNSFNTGGSKKCKTSQSFESLFDSESLSDVRISINDGSYTFHGHKMIIGLKSPILAALMNDLPTTGEETPMLHLNETEECSHVFHRFLYFVYSGAVWLHQDYVVPLQKLAVKYDVVPLIQHCESYILQILNSTFSSVRSPSRGEDQREQAGFSVEVTCDLHESNSMGEHVKNVAFMVLCTRAKDIIHSPRWRTCGYDVVCELLKNDECQAVENALLTAATNWMKSNNLQDKSKIEGILTNIRYPLLHRRVLYHLQKNNAFKNFPPVQDLVNAAIRYHCFKDLPEAKGDFKGIQYTPRVPRSPDGARETPSVLPDPDPDRVPQEYENTQPSPQH